MCRHAITKATVSAWRVSLEGRGLGSSSLIVRMSAIRKLAAEAADNGLLAPEVATGILKVKGVNSTGTRMGNWLSLQQAQALLSAPQNAQKDIHPARVHARKAPLPGKPRTPARWQTAIDPLNHDAVLRAHSADDTTQDAQIPRTEIDRIARFLEQALKRFDSGGEMRQ